MQGTNHNIFVRIFKQKVSAVKLVRKLSLVVSENKFDRPTGTSMTENFNIFGFQRASCRERNPTSEKRNPVSRKINSETEGGNAAKNYEKRWNWISTRVKWLCSLWPFQPIFVLLGGTKHNSHNWIYFLNWIENLNWILGLAEKEFQYRKIIHEVRSEKRKVCVSKQEFKTLF